MRRNVLICILVLDLVLSWSMVWAEDFYVIPVAKKNYAPVEKTGQTGCWDSVGIPTICPGTGQDGRYQKGVHWPSPRFTANVDNNGDGDCADAGESCDGTVTDNLTGLIWLKDADCVSFFQDDPIGFNYRNWTDALTAANLLASGYCGLTDGFSDWRLPNIKELQSLIDFGSYSPALPSDHPFTGVQSGYYWSSTSYAASPDYAWFVGLYNGVVSGGSKGDGGYVWPVRGGQ